MANIKHGVIFLIASLVLMMTWLSAWGLYVCIVVRFGIWGKTTPAVKHLPLKSWTFYFAMMVGDNLFTLVGAWLISSVPWHRAPPPSDQPIRRLRPTGVTEGLRVFSLCGLVGATILLGLDLFTDWLPGEARGVGIALVTAIRVLVDYLLLRHISRIATDLGNTGLRNHARATGIMIVLTMIGAWAFIYLFDTIKKQLFKDTAIYTLLGVTVLLLALSAWVLLLLLATYRVVHAADRTA